MSALSPWKLLSAAVTDRKNKCREEERGEKIRQGLTERTEKGMRGWLRPESMVLREETASVKAECGLYICSSLHPPLLCLLYLSIYLSIYLPLFLSPPLSLSFSLSLSALPGASLSIMCGDSVRRWRIIPVFRAATTRPSFSSSSSSSSSSLSTPLTSQAWISLYHLSQPRLCHSAPFAQREVWKVCVCASVRECVPTCVMIPVCECNCVYMCLCMLVSLCTCVCVLCVCVGGGGV